MCGVADRTVCPAGSRIDRVAMLTVFKRNKLWVGKYFISLTAIVVMLEIAMVFL